MPNGVETAYAYDNLLRTKSIAHRDPQDATAASFAYEVGRTGRRLGVAEETDGVTAEWAYRYDGLGLLTDATRLVLAGDTAYRYRYDEAGNRLAKGVDDVTTTYAYNALDQLTSETTSGVTTDYEYDGNGNLSRKSSPGNDIHYVYDSRNRLVKVYNGAIQGTPWLGSGLRGGGFAIWAAFR